MLGCSFRSSLIYMFSQAELEELALHAAETLQMAKRFGKVVLVTNAECGWIELSCRKWMPSLYPHLEDVRLFSARSTYEAQGEEEELVMMIDSYYHRYCYCYCYGC